MLSELGVEFLAYFGASRDQNVLKEVKKLYVSYKQRDSILLETKKSILYSLIIKTVITIYSQMSDSQIMRIADSTVAELQKDMTSQEEGGLDKFKNSIYNQIEVYARVRNI